MNKYIFVFVSLLIFTSLVIASCSFIGGSGLGGAQVRLNGIQVSVLDSVLSGAGDIQASGTADELKLVLSGLGDFNAADLQSNKANIELSGMGGATVRVEDDLAATITGAGSIQYFGNPHVEQSINGAGSVKPAG